MTFYNYNFLCVQSFTLEFGVAILTGIFTILTLLIVLLNVSELSSMISGNPLVLATIFLLLLTWAMAIAGANSRSRKLIASSIVIWAIFVIDWLVLSLYFRILMNNTDFCVALNTRCAPSMWLIGSGGGGVYVNNDTLDDGNSTEDTDIDDNKLWSVIDLPEVTVKNFHPVRTNVVPIATPVVATTANTVISNQTSMAIDVNNGCGCERHPMTTTESPPSDLRTRVIEYRKNMAMYRQTAEAAIQRRKKKEGKKKQVENDNKDENKDDDNETGSGDGDDDDDEDPEETNVEYKAAVGLIDYLTMAFFLLLFLYALYVLLSYHSELKFMQDCKCTILT